MKRIQKPDKIDDIDTKRYFCIVKGTRQDTFLHFIYESTAMAHKSSILIIAAGLLLITLCGCLDSTRKESSQLRWQRRMDRVRLQAAAQSVDEGRLIYAERVLNECGQCSDPTSDVAVQVEQLRVRIQAERNRYAKLDSQPANPDQMTY